MEYLVLQIVAFLRPILFVEVGAGNVFDIGGIGIIAALFSALLIRAAIGQQLNLGTIDALIAAFAVWCVACAIIYPETLDLRGLAKLVAPLLGYTVVKNIVETDQQFWHVVLLMILGYVLPVVGSAVLIMLGMGAEAYGANYWTGILRWEGLFDGAHNLGHNMTFLLMLLLTYVVFGKRQSSGPRRKFNLPVFIGLGVLAALALYCLWMSQVRTALLGLLVFLTILGFYRNKKLLVGSAVVGVLAMAAFYPVLKPYLFPDVVMVERTGADAGELASGRPGRWRDNLDAFANLPLDRQLAGAGIGHNRLDGFVDSHNDILDVMVQTGVIGLALFLAIQYMLLRRIMQLPGPERYAFVALFVAVLAMNVASNSYVARFGLAQMFYYVIAYVELRARRDDRAVTARLGAESPHRPDLSRAPR